MVGSERLTVFSDSWFSAKAIQVVHSFKINPGKALINLGGRLIGSFDISKTHNGIIINKKQADLQCEGLKSKGKQPRS